jgi:DNA modification methylase
MNEIICADCLEVLKSMPDKSVDLVLTDPPYGIGVDYGAYEDSQDNLRELIAKFMPEVLRIGKVVALTPGNKNIFLYPKPDWILSWVVPAGTGMSCWGFVCWHAILVYGKDPYLVNNLGSRPDIIIGDNLKVNHDHPCAKPLNVWKKILERCSVKESDTILDPFAGSGTTCVAAKILGRKYIGIEISPVYAEIARKRVEQAQYEERLFAVTV